MAWQEPDSQGNQPGKPVHGPTLARTPVALPQWRRPALRLRLRDRATFIQLQPALVSNVV